MTINFIKPCILWIIPFALAVVFLIGAVNIKEKRIHKNKFKLFVTAFRMLIVFLIIFSAAAPEVNLISDKIQTVFVVDLSQSLGNSQKIVEFINEKLKTKPEDEEVGLIAFGSNSIVEYLPSKNNTFFDISEYPDAEATDIEGALKAALYSAEGGSVKHMVLVSDGAENYGNAAAFADKIKASGGIADTYYIKTDIKDEVQLSSVNTDLRINKSSEYSIEVNVFSKSENSGILRLYKNNNLFYESNVSLDKGENHFAVSDRADEGGEIFVKAEILPQKDKFKINNINYCYTYVSDSPKVLILENQNKSGENIYNVLSLSGIDVQREYCANEYDLKALSAYDEIIAADCSYDEISEKNVKAIEEYVKNGGGFFVTGGENSLGLGNYEGTILEDMLPVNMRPIDKGDSGGLALCVVIDRSGSMGEVSYGVSGLSLAKDAVLAAVDELDDEDSFAAAVFDDTSEIICELMSIGDNRENIKNSIKKIAPGGGTDIASGLESAVAAVEKSDKENKHIILLSDGQSENSRYYDIINRLTKSNITLSCVAVGADADTELLSRLAQTGGGSYYYTNEFGSLPRIFINDTKKAEKKYINEADFYPTLAMNTAFTSNIEAIPLLNGYISVSAKETAEVVLTSDCNEPVLAFSKYGLGKTGVFASDAENWCGVWFSSKEGTDIFTAAVSELLRNNNFENIKTEIKNENGHKYIYAQADDASVNIKNGKLSGDGNETVLSFEPVSARRFRAEADNLTEGFYSVILNYDDEYTNDNSFASFISIGWPEEYDFSQEAEGERLMRELAQKSGGRFLNEDDNFFEAFDAIVYKNKNLSNILMTFSLILFIIDIGVRRFKNPVIDFVKKLFARTDKQKNKNDVDSTTAYDVKSAEGETIKTAELLALKKKHSGR